MLALFAVPAQVKVRKGDERRPGGFNKSWSGIRLIEIRQPGDQGGQLRRRPPAREDLKAPATPHDDIEPPVFMAEDFGDMGRRTNVVGRRLIVDFRAGRYQHHAEGGIVILALRNQSLIPFFEDVKWQLGARKQDGVQWKQRQFHVRR
jgi:hypothetical protein